ncbi:MAG: hypothetical protein OSJ70_01190 [Bacilli bacterium]|nr:hypothetical protein [Bacilli bacterium]
MSKLHESIKVSAVEFWEFIFAMGFALLSFNTIAWGINKGVNEALFSGGKVMEYFIILTGVYLVATYEKLKNKKTKKISTWKYVKENLVNYYPAILSGVLIVFIVRNVINATSIIRIPRLLVGSLLELFGLSQTGILTYGLFPGNQALADAIANGGINILWNEPLTYLSAMIIAGAFLFYALSHNEELYKNIICPLAVIFGYGTLSIMGEYSSINFTSFGISAILIRSLAGLALGSLIYYFASHLKEKHYPLFSKSFLTIINLLFIIYFIWSFIFGIEWGDAVNMIFIVPFIVINLLGEDYISENLDNHFSIYLGQIALYIFSSHIAFVYLIPHLLPTLSFANSTVIYMLVCFVWANFMYLFDSFVVSPLFRRK